MREAAVQERARAMADFMMPEGLNEEEKLRFYAEHSELLLSLAELIRAENQKYTEAETAKKVALDAYNGLGAQKARAERDNADLDELAGKRNYLTELLEQAETMGQLDTRVTRVENAVREVQPKDRAVREAKADVEECEKNIGQLAKQAQEATQVRTQAEQAVTADSDKKAAIDSLKAEQKTIRSSEKSYRDLEEAKKAEAKAKQEKITVNGKIGKDSADIANLEKVLQELEEKIEGLQDIDTEVYKAAIACKEAENLLKQVTGPEGLKDQMAQITEEAGREKRMSEQYRELELDATAAMDAYAESYRAFLGGQASLLSMELETALEQEGEANPGADGGCETAGTQRSGAYAAESGLYERKGCFAGADCRSGLF